MTIDNFKSHKLHTKYGLLEKSRFFLAIEAFYRFILSINHTINKRTVMETIPGKLIIK